MKKPYVKPMITVERLMIDQPMAVGCNANTDDMNSLLELGYFTEEKNCSIKISVDGPVQGYDTICYHSNVQTAFTS